MFKICSYIPTSKEDISPMAGLSDDIWLYPTFDNLRAEPRIYSEGTSEDLYSQAGTTSSGSAPSACALA